MTVVPARVAGVERVVVCTPPGRDGFVPDAVLYAASVAGADAVYRVGGTHAVAALAYGTESIPRVDKVVGPGNVWVTAAKRELAGVVGVDGLAGPTELVIVADGSSDPAMLAVDLVAQAEHDPGATATLVALERRLADSLPPAVRRETEASPRREIVGRSIESARLVLVPDVAAAAEVVERLAPEHLQVATADPGAFLDRVRSFGAAFLGPLTPVSFGDYGVGSNHVLPTMGTARFASGLRATDFVTVSSFAEASEEGLHVFGQEVEAVAESEGLPGHARASRSRRTMGGRP
jgi:histidinol dehydrogenase